MRVRVKENKGFKASLIGVTAAMLAVLITVPVFAYFIKNFQSDQSFQMSPDNSGIVVDVADFEALRVAAADLTESTVSSGVLVLSGEYNGGNTVVSDPAARRILRLTENISLACDLTVTADCHFDLNGYTLDLNGHSITFRHSFAGSIVIDGGGGKLIVSDPPDGSDEIPVPAIYLDAPNIASLDFTDVTVETASGTAYSGDLYTDITGEGRSLAYQAFRLISDSLVNISDARPAELDFGDLSALTLEQTDGVDSFPSSLVLTPRTCSLNGDAAHACTFVFGDIDLPNRLMYRDGVTITYTSDNPSVVSEYGKVTPSADGIVTVTLTATVARDGVTIGTCAFVIHVVDPSVASQCETAAQMLLTEFMQRFYRSEEDLFVFLRAAQLPLKLVFGTTEMPLTWAVFDAEGAEENIAGTTWLTEPGGAVTCFTPSTAATRLDVTFGSTTLQFPMRSGVSMLIESDASIAKQFLKRVYTGNGDRLIVRGTEDGSHYYPTILEDPDDIALQKGITSVSYAILQDVDGIYEIATDKVNVGDIEDQKVIRVAAGKDPSASVETVIVECTFDFKNGNREKLLMEVVCTYGESGSDNVSGFLPYYTYYNTRFLRQTAGYTIDGFLMPLSYGRKAVVVYDIATYSEADGQWVINRDGLPVSISLFYNNTDHDIGSPSAGASYTDLLDSYLTANSLTLEDIIAYGDAQWKFSIDQSAIPPQNTEYLLYYNYKLGIWDSAWTLYVLSEEDESGNVISTEPIVSDLTVPGVLHLGTGSGYEVQDTNLYTWMYNHFSTGGTYTGSELILTDWLLQNVPLDVTADATLAAVTDFAGIQYLVGTQYVDLSGSEDADRISAVDAATVMGYLCQMTSLETLILSYNQFYDRTSPNDADNGMFDGIGALTHLKTLYLDYNDIYSFEFLLELSALESVYVNGNLEEGTAAGTFYGSVGLTNYAVFQDLEQNGVSVYNTATVSGSNTVYKLFEDSAEINDYVNLRSIEYQSKLEAGQNITALYANFSTDVNSYQLKTSYLSDNDVTNQSLTWGYLDENGTVLTDPDNAAALTSETFVLTYRLTVSGTDVTLLIKYGVTRI